MSFKKGLIVKALSGRDKEDFFVVIDYNSLFVNICNGKRRTLLKPKRKNPKHLIVTKTILSEDFLKSDKSIRKALMTFKEKHLGGRFCPSKT